MPENFEVQRPTQEELVMAEEARALMRAAKARGEKLNMLDAMTRVFNDRGLTEAARAQARNGVATALGETQWWKDDRQGQLL